MSPDHTALEVDISRALSPREWMTSLEIMNRCPGWTYKLIHDRLKLMADTEYIASRIGGEPDRPVREYRAWR